MLRRPLLPSTMLAFVLLFAAVPCALSAQAEDTGPWWPHPMWGPDDQAGGSNWITPEKVLEALELVEAGEIYELGHVYERSMPGGARGTRTYANFIPATQGVTLGEDLVYNTELLVANIGQVGTQFDGPAHIGKRVTREDGTTENVFYNGVRWTEMQDAYEMRRLGVENVRPYLTRGVLIDVAGYKGVETLPDGYVVTLEDVRGALAAQGMSEADIRPGDAVLFNFGWWRLWPDPKVMGFGWPGIGREVADWVVERQASMVGSDAATDEVTQWAVHDLLTLQHGIFNLEMMTFEELLADEVHEFLFVFTPLRLKGASGSPGRPIAVR